MVMSKITPLYNTLGSKRWMQGLTHDEFHEVVMLTIDYQRELERRVNLGVSPFASGGEVPGVERDRRCQSRLQALDRDPWQDR